MRLGLFLMVALLLSAAAGVTHASQILLMSPASRAAGMGHCFVGVADDAAACFWNPGGLPFVEARLSAVGMNTEPLPDWGGFDYWSGAVAFRTERFGAIGASFMHLSHAKGIYEPDPWGTPVYIPFAPSETVWSVAYGLAPLEHLGVGVNVKHVRSLTLPEDLYESTDGSASALAFDLGMLYRFPHSLGSWDALLRVGAAGQDLGSDMELDGELYGNPQRWPLPREFKLGVSYRIGNAASTEALACFEYTRSLGTEEYSMFYSEHPVYGLGLELRSSVSSLLAGERGTASSSTRDVFAVRLGYVHDHYGEVKDFSFGFGFGLSFGPREQGSSLMLDFANVPQAEELTRPWHVGVSASF